VILKGGAVVLQQAGLVPLSNDVGEVEAVREGVMRVILLDYVRSGGTITPDKIGLIASSLNTAYSASIPSRLAPSRSVR
jgi:hypothetical protein